MLFISPFREEKYVWEFGAKKSCEGVELNKCLTFGSSVKEVKIIEESQVGSDSEEFDAEYCVALDRIDEDAKRCGSGHPSPSFLNLIYIQFTPA